MGSTALSSAASTRSGTLLAYVERRGAGLFGFGGIHSFLDLRGEVIEGLLDIDVVLCRHFEEGNSKFVGQLLPLLG